MSAKEYADYMVRGNAPMGRCVGAHLYIDHLGQIFQYADLGVYRARRHPPVDESAIWIVMQNKGEPPFDPRVPRGVYRYIFGKKEGPSLCCTSDQVDSLMDVIDLICRSMSIPMGIPRTKAMDPVAKKLSSKKLDRWSGILLASHAAPVLSPGPCVLEALDELEQMFLSELYEEDEEDEGEPGDGTEEFDEEAFEKAFPDLA
jgi:hypothetical protein